MKITEEEKAYRREKIIQVAFKLFCDKGIEKISMEDIAKKAHVGNTTIYRYFTNKPLLVLDTLSVLWKKIGEELERSVWESEDYDNMSGLQQIRVQLEGLRRLYIENTDYVLFSYEAKMYLVRNSVQLSREQYDAIMFDIKEPCVAALEKGRRDNTIPVEPDISSEDLFYVIWGAVRGYIVKIVIYNDLCEGESIWEQKYDLLENGILCALKFGWNSV